LKFIVEQLVQKIKVLAGKELRERDKVNLKMKSQEVVGEIRLRWLGILVLIWQVDRTGHKQMAVSIRVEIGVFF
jgi:hypothetical protein